MKPTDALTTLFSHNLWANLRLLEGCAGLSNKQLDATISGTYGSIRDTLQHIVTGEQLYFSLISTGQRYDRQEGASPLTLAEMKELVCTTGDGLIEWAPNVQANDMAKTIRTLCRRPSFSPKRSTTLPNIAPRSWRS